MHSIVDFTREDRGTGDLVRAVPRVDPLDSTRQAWDLDIAFTVDDGEAEQVEGVVPQVGEHLARARSGKAATSITIKPGDRDVLLTLQDGLGDPVLLAVPAEVRQVRLTLTDKAQAYVARVRVQGLNPEQGAGLLAMLGGAVGVYVQPAQMELTFDEPAKLGTVVSGSDGHKDVFGLLVNRKGDSYVIEDFDVLHTVPHLSANIDLDEREHEHVAAYVAEVRAMNAAPSWRCIVQALAEDGGGRVTAKVAKLAASYHLPPEAGAAHG
jgi:hypothetical protein